MEIWAIVWGVAAAAAATAAVTPKNTFLPQFGKVCVFGAAFELGRHE